MLRNRFSTSSQVSIGCAETAFFCPGQLWEAVCVRGTRGIEFCKFVTSPQHCWSIVFGNSEAVRWSRGKVSSYGASFLSHSLGRSFGTSGPGIVRNACESWLGNLAGAQRAGCLITGRGVTFRCGARARGNDQTASGVVEAVGGVGPRCLLAGAHRGLAASQATQQSRSSRE
jgi:hypothetical protein